MKRKPVVFIVGPTAVGKTEAAVKLAQKINAEIVSCDSMQIYKGMEIITSKPALSLRKKIPHHLLDLISPAKVYNVAKYRKEALKKVKEIIKKGKVPLFVGGTGLYISLLIDGIFECRAQDNAIRNRLFNESGRFGSKGLYARLKRVDPKAAAKIHPNDARRIIRALEVFETTGKRISDLQKQRQGLSKDYDVKIFCLDMTREKLNKRIDARVEKMFAKGLVQEVKKLLKLKLSRTASYAIGIREIKGYLAGEYDLDQAKRLMSKSSRLYAKRQLTWFRKDKRINWIKVDFNEKPKDIALKIWKKLY